MWRMRRRQQLDDKLAAFVASRFKHDIRDAWEDSEDYIETEIGRYPSSWSVVELGDALELIIDKRGVTPKKLGSDWSNDGILALSAKSVKNHRLVNLDLANHVSPELYERWMPDKLNCRDILMTSEAPLGEFYYLAIEHEYCLSQRLFALRANRQIIEPSLLYFSLIDSVGLNQIDARKTGTTVTGIRQSELVRVPVVIPDTDTQARFATLANPVLELIEVNNKEIFTLEEARVCMLTNLGR